jgi:uncharacterized membrane protein
MSRKIPSHKTVEKNKVPTPLELPKDVLDSLNPEELEIIEDLPLEKRARFISIFMAKTSSFRGPIPPPELLAGYNDAIEGGADRILKMAEKQLDHRIALEADVIKGQQKQSGRGQIFGFILAFLCLGSSTFLGYNNHEVLAGTLGTTTILGLAAVFVLGKVRQEKDLSEKK